MSLDATGIARHDGTSSSVLWDLSRGTGIGQVESGLQGPLSQDPLYVKLCPIGPCNGSKVSRLVRSQEFSNSETAAECAGLCAHRNLATAKQRRSEQARALRRRGQRRCWHRAGHATQRPSSTTVGHALSRGWPPGAPVLLYKVDPLVWICTRRPKRQSRRGGGRAFQMKTRPCAHAHRTCVLRACSRSRLTDGTTTPGDGDTHRWLIRSFEA